MFGLFVNRLSVMVLIIMFWYSLSLIKSIDRITNVTIIESDLSIIIMTKINGIHAIQVWQ